MIQYVIYIYNSRCRHIFPHAVGICWNQQDGSNTCNNLPLRRWPLSGNRSLPFPVSNQSLECGEPSRKNILYIIIHCIFFWLFLGDVKSSNILDMAKFLLHCNGEPHPTRTRRWFKICWLDWTAWKLRDYRTIAWYLTIICSEYTF